MAIPFVWEYPTTSRRVASIPKPETHSCKHISFRFGSHSIDSSFLYADNAINIRTISTFSLKYYLRVQRSFCYEALLPLSPPSDLFLSLSSRNSKISSHRSRLKSSLITMSNITLKDIKQWNIQRQLTIICESHCFFFFKCSSPLTQIVFALLIIQKMHLFVYKL